MTGGMKYAFTCTMLHTSGGSSYATRLACVETRPWLNVICICDVRLALKTTARPCRYPQHVFTSQQVSAQALSPVIFVSAAFFLPGQSPNNVSRVDEACCIQGILSD